MSGTDPTVRALGPQSSVLSPRHAHHVVIIGGGIAGLSTAYALQEQARLAGIPLACTLIEAQERLGGVILTERVDGFVIEAGPDSLLTQKPWGLELCQTLGIGDRLIGTNDGQRTIYILWDGRLQPLPAGLMLVVPTRLGPLLRSQLLSWPGKIRMGLEYLLPSRPSDGDESLAAFVRRRLGREALDKIADPLLAGIYAGSSQDMSLLATFPRLRELELTHGGLIRGVLAQRRTLHRTPAANSQPTTTLFMAPRGGMAEIVEALSSRLDQVALRLGETVQRVVPHGDGAAAPQGYAVHLDGATTLQAEAVVCATPAHITAGIVEGFHPRLAAALRAIPYVSSATISLAYRRRDVSHPLDGFGFLVGKHEGRRIMAATWTSTKFPHRAPADHVLIRSFIGGVGGEDLVRRDDAALIQLVGEELGAILGITTAPVLARVYRWERANPQYLVGHLERVDAMEQMLAPYPGLLLTGSAYRGVGVPDCIHQGILTAERLLALLAPAV
ncbi:MAG: protoporphyrinogen oxidase [Candidatus Entotheonellia bacterium]